VRVPGISSEFVHVTTVYSVRNVITYLMSLFLQVFIVFIVLNGVRLSPLGTEATIGLLYQPQMIGDGDCGAIDKMKIGTGNRSTRRRPLSTTNPT
jgi:hypothetical protein